jgi:hypothetical protein
MDEFLPPCSWNLGSKPVTSESKTLQPPVRPESVFFRNIFDKQDAF